MEEGLKEMFGLAQRLPLGGPTRKRTGRCRKESYRASHRGQRPIAPLQDQVSDLARRLAVVLLMKKKHREAGFGPASYRLAETFSLCKSLSSPQQLIAVVPHSTDK